MFASKSYFPPPRVKLRPDGKFLVREDQAAAILQRRRRLKLEGRPLRPGFAGEKRPYADYTWGLFFFFGALFGMALAPLSGRSDAGYAAKPVLEETAREEYLLSKRILEATVAILRDINSRSDISKAPSTGALEVAPEPLGLQVIAKKKKVRLRAEPSLESQILGVVEAGTVLFAKSLKDGWVRVSFYKPLPCFADEL